jgi:hypothetical protein
MKRERANALLAELDELEDLFLQCRAVFPTLSSDLIGKNSFSTAPYYMQKGYQASVALGNPISIDFIERNRRLGKWINENAIIRLHGIIEHHGLLEKIDQKINGWKEVDLMRRMRNAFTKTSLNYKPNKEENIKLREELINYFNLPKEEFSSGEIPTPIDTVVEPIFKGCKEYIKGKGAQHGAGAEAKTVCS